MNDFRNLKSPKIVVEPPGPKVRKLMKLGLLKSLRYTQPIMEKAQGIFINSCGLLVGKCEILAEAPRSVRLKLAGEAFSGRDIMHGGPDAGF